VCVNCLKKTLKVALFPRFVDPDPHYFELLDPDPHPGGQKLLAKREVLDVLF
jgi:hypothetical protein